MCVRTGTPSYDTVKFVSGVTIIEKLFVPMAGSQTESRLSDLLPVRPTYTHKSCHRRRHYQLVGLELVSVGVTVVFGVLSKTPSNISQDL